MWRKKKMTNEEWIEAAKKIIGCRKLDPKVCISYASDCANCPYDCDISQDEVVEQLVRIVEEQKKQLDESNSQ